MENYGQSLTILRIELETNILMARQELSQKLYSQLPTSLKRFEGQLSILNGISLAQLN